MDDATRAQIDEDRKAIAVFLLMNIPIFDGSDLNGVEGWINVLGRVLKAGRFPPLAAMKLEEGALEWWIGEGTVPQFYKWNDFADGLRTWCRHQRTLGRWKYWIRGTNESVKDYATRFRKEILSEVPPSLSKEELAVGFLIHMPRIT